MKCLFVCCFYSFSLISWSQNWSQLANFSGDSRDDASTFTIGNFVYCGLGMNAGFACNNDFYKFDLTTETWMQSVSIPSNQARQYATGFSHAGKGYIFGGITGNATYLSDLWEFDPTSETWSALPPCPSVGVSGAMSFVIADTVYIVGGKLADGSFSSEVWAYDFVQQNWFQRASIPSDGIWRGISFLRNNHGIIGGGKLNSGSLNSTFYEYNSQTNLWENWSAINFLPRTYAMFAQIDSVGFVYGGVLADNSYSNAFSKINLDTKEVIDLTAFPNLARRGGIGFICENEFYITTGVTSQGRLNETWKASAILKLNEFEPLGALKLFPNPAKNSVQIQAKESIDRVEIESLTGKKVAEFDVDSSDFTVSINLSNGMYWIKIYAVNRVYLERIVIEN